MKPLKKQRETGIPGKRKVEKINERRVKGC